MNYAGFVVFVTDNQRAYQSAVKILQRKSKMIVPATKNLPPINRVESSVSSSEVRS